MLVALSLTSTELFFFKDFPFLLSKLDASDYECMYVCMYYVNVCMYVYFNKWRSDRVLVRLGLNTLIGWMHVVR